MAAGEELLLCVNNDVLHWGLNQSDPREEVDLHCPHSRAV